MKKSRIRSSLMGAVTLLTSSILLAIMSGCGHDRTDTENYAPPNNISNEVTNVCVSTTTTISTTSLTTISTTNLWTTSSMTTLTTTTTVVTTLMTETVATENQTTTEIKTEPVNIATEPIAVEPINKEVAEEVTYCELPITEQEFILLCNVVSHEAGSSWISEYERSCIVACVMNRVYDSRFPNTIDEVVHQPNQMFDVPYYRVDYSGVGYEPIDNAIYAYFNGTYNYGCINSWSGNGYNNTFYYQ